MTYEVALMGTAIHMLIWEKFPEWGTWFNTLLSYMPQPIQTLYEQWRCPYCAGFWITLVLHGLTGQWTLPMLAELSFGPAWLGLCLAWFLDGLVGATLITLGILLINALRLPAMQAHMKKQEFMQSFSKTAEAEG